MKVQPTTAINLKADCPRLAPGFFIAKKPRTVKGTGGQPSESKTRVISRVEHRVGTREIHHSWRGTLLKVPLVALADLDPFADAVDLTAPLFPLPLFRPSAVNRLFNHFAPVPFSPRSSILDPHLSSFLPCTKNHSSQLVTAARLPRRLGARSRNWPLAVLGWFASKEALVGSWQALVESKTPKPATDSRLLSPDPWRDLSSSANAEDFSISLSPSWRLPQQWTMRGQNEAPFRRAHDAITPTNHDVSANRCAQNSPILHYLLWDPFSPAQNADDLLRWGGKIFPRIRLHSLHRPLSCV